MADSEMCRMPKKKGKRCTVMRGDTVQLGIQIKKAVKIKVILLVLY